MVYCIVYSWHFKNISLHQMFIDLSWDYPPPPPPPQFCCMPSIFTLMPMRIYTFQFMPVFFFFLKLVERLWRFKCGQLKALLYLTCHINIYRQYFIAWTCMHISSIKISSTAWMMLYYWNNPDIRAIFSITTDIIFLSFSLFKWFMR